VGGVKSFKQPVSSIQLHRHVPGLQAAAQMVRQQATSLKWKGCASCSLSAAHNRNQHRSRHSSKNQGHTRATLHVHPHTNIHTRQRNQRAVNSSVAYLAWILHSQQGPRGTKG
jgi:hypothetical protein